jgi:hypothetical protein
MITNQESQTQHPVCKFSEVSVHMLNPSISRVVHGVITFSKVIDSPNSSHSQLPPSLINMTFHSPFRKYLKSLEILSGRRSPQAGDDPLSGELLGRVMRESWQSILELFSMVIRLTSTARNSSQDFPWSCSRFQPVVGLILTNPPSTWPVRSLSVSGLSNGIILCVRDVRDVCWLINDTVYGSHWEYTRQ